MSSVSTEQIRVSVAPNFHPEHSNPAQRYWFFSYTIEIANEGDSAVQLIERFWRITDATGNVEIVKGPGVVGQTPLLSPGHSFTYTSFCPLSTPFGSMEGSYTMRREDGTTFEAQIALFALEDPDAIN